MSRGAEQSRQGARFVLIPGALALLDDYAGLNDPVADVRRAVVSAVGESASGVERVVVVASRDVGNQARGVLAARGVRVARSALAAVGCDAAVLEVVVNECGDRARAQPTPLPSPSPGDLWLIVANGSARRTEKAPGHLDEGAVGFDAQVGKAIDAGDFAAIAKVDRAEAARQWADLEPLIVTAELLSGRAVPQTQMLLDDDPFGVQYWIATWETSCDY